MNREALRLYLVTNRYQDSVESFLEKVEMTCRSGVTIVQLREKKSYNQSILSTGKKSQGNNRYLSGTLDNRWSVGYLSCSRCCWSAYWRRWTTSSVARQVLGPDKILGVTAKTVERALEAEESGADYLGTGAIFPTTTKEKCTHHPDFNLENNLPNGCHSSSCYWRLDVREHWTAYWHWHSWCSCSAWFDAGRRYRGKNASLLNKVGWHYFLINTQWKSKSKLGS